MKYDKTGILYNQFKIDLWTTNCVSITIKMNGEELEIILNNSKLSFIGGQTIKGKVQLQLMSEQKLRGKNKITFAIHFW